LFAVDETHSDRPSVADASPARSQKSKVGNNPSLLPGADNRGPWCRRRRDLIDEICADMGGPEALSAKERVLVNRASTLITQLELLEARFSAGEQAPEVLDLYGRQVSTLRRLIECLGVKAVPRDASSLEAYLASKGRSVA